MTKRGRKPVRLTLGLAAVSLLAATAGFSRHESRQTFKYVGGTEDILAGCEGAIELSSSSLTFKCAQYSVAIPYSSITLMQYRPDVSREVRKMKLKWKVEPPAGGGRRNRFFAVIFATEGRTRAIVWEVQPSTMLPYLAELELKTGKRVEVKGYEEYD